MEGAAEREGAEESANARSARPGGRYSRPQGATGGLRR